MSICLANEYFPPHAPDEVEWSTAALAQALARRHVEEGFDPDRTVDRLPALYREVDAA